MLRQIAPLFGVSKSAADRIVDRHGTPLAVRLTGGNRHDVTQVVLPLMNAARRSGACPRTEATASTSTAGLELERRVADWDGAPFAQDSTKHISVWRKPA